MKRKFLLLFIITLLQLNNFLLINQLDLTKQSDNHADLSGFEENISKDLSLNQNFSLDSPFNNSRILIRENNYFIEQETINSSLVLDSSIPALWNAYPTFENATYNLISNAELENTSLWLDSEENNIHQTIGYNNYSATDGPNGTGCTSFYFNTNNSISQHVVFKNTLLEDNNIPNLYFSSTTLDFDFSVSELIGDYINTDHQIYLQLFFGNSTNSVEIDIYIKYNPDNLPTNYYVSPGVYCSYPLIILLANAEQNSSWIHFSKNITALIHECFPDDKYSDFIYSLNELYDVKLKIDIMSFTGIFEGTVLLDNIKIHSKISNQPASSLVNFGVLTQNTTHFEINPQAVNIDRFTGFVNYQINNSLSYYSTAIVYPKNKNELYANLTLFEYNMSLHGKNTEITLFVPVLWNIDNATLSMNSSLQEFYNDSSFNVFRILVLPEIQNIGFILENILSSCLFQQYLETGDFFQIIGSLDLISTNYIVYQLVDKDNNIIMEERVLCFSNGYFEFSNIRIPEEMSAGLYFQRVFIEDYPFLGYFSEYIDILVKNEIFVRNFEFSPLYEFEQADFSVEVVDQADFSIQNATLYIIGPFGSFKMEFSQDTEQYCYHFTFLNINAGDYIVTVNISYDSLILSKDFSITVKSTELSIVIENFPSNIYPNDTVSLSLQCFKNNTLSGFNSFNYGVLYFYINETLQNIKNVEDGNLTFYFGNFPQDSKFVILHFYLKIFSITYASKIIGVNFVNLIEKNVYLTANPSFYDVEIKNTNSTTNLLYYVNYPQIGEFWQINFKELGILPEECRIKRNDIEYIVNINNTFLQWNLKSFNNESDILIIKVKTPSLFLTRDINEDMAIIDVKITTNSSIPNFYAVIDTIGYETDILDWKIYNSLNDDVTSEYIFEVLNAKIIMFNLSLNCNGVIYIKLSGKLPDFIIFDSEFLPNNPQYFDIITIKYNVSYSSYLVGKIEYLIDDKITLNQAMFSTNNDGNRLLFVDIGPYKWNTNITIVVKILNSANQILHEKRQIILIHDFTNPEVVSNVLFEHSAVNITVKASESVFASGIHNCSIIYSDFQNLIEKVKISNYTHIFSIEISYEFWEETIGIEIFDNAGNRIFLNKTNFVILNDLNDQHSVYTTQFKDLINILLPVGTGLLGVLSSITLFILRKSGQIIEL